MLLSGFNRVTGFPVTLFFCFQVVQLHHYKRCAGVEQGFRRTPVSLKMLLGSNLLLINMAAVVAVVFCSIKKSKKLQNKKYF
jgi:hypothetical protein